MDNLARQVLLDQVLDDLNDYQMECDVVDFRTAEDIENDSLSLNFVNEIDAWARHALALNGFGDFV